jgi:hypothetical protein
MVGEAEQAGKKERKQEGERPPTSKPVLNGRNPGVGNTKHVSFFVILILMPSPHCLLTFHGGNY